MHVHTIFSEDVVIFVIVIINKNNAALKMIFLSKLVNGTLLNGLKRQIKNKDIYILKNKSSMYK